MTETRLKSVFVDKKISRRFLENFVHLNNPIWDTYLLIPVGNERIIDIRSII